ncbi:MAG TPA: response regulator [Anaerolineaceae bacterium]|nr:response regulator [Anaerolineaceae bacterium]
MLKVLVIDDDLAMTEILKYQLTSNGLEVKVVNDGQTGLNSIESFKPNIIILDLLMPELDGWEVCKTIKSKNKIPVLILSAVDNPIRIAQTLDAGADDYLIKPVSSTSLIAHINNLVRRSEKQSALDNRKNQIQFSS